MTETKKNTFDTTLTVADMCRKYHADIRKVVTLFELMGNLDEAGAVSGIHCRRRRKNPAHHAGMTQATDKPQAA